jgi:predicted dehydrogenase
MLQGDDPIDLLDVCLPLSERYEAVAAGLRAGANILCPAPFAPTVEQSIALTALAAERERILMPAMPLRYHPSVLFLHELIENDDLGRLEMFRCRLGEGSPEPGTDIRVGVALRGIDLFRFLCGEAATLSGRLARAHAESEGPDRAALLLQGEAGAIGVVEATQNAVGTQNVLELYGSAGAFLADLDLFTCRFLTADQPLWQGRSEGGPEAIERMLGHFADTVRGLQSPLTTAEDGWKGFALLSGVA